MNFHTFVLISTIIFYIVLRMYKRNIKQENLNKSNLLYVLFLPFIMYLYHFMYGVPQSTTVLSEMNNLQKIPNNINTLNINTLHENSIFDSIRSSEPLLTSPFPESTIGISTSSSK
jgi:hypothetical protein